MSKLININDLKSRLNRDDILSILTGYGYDVSKCNHVNGLFCLRDERTPSAMVNLNCTIHDHGSDYHGDIFDTLKEFQNMSLPDAIKAVAGHINYSCDDNVPTRQPQRPKEIKTTLSDEVHAQMLKTLEWYDTKQDLQTFKNKEYRDEALSICPLWVYKQAKPHSIELFKKLTTYDFKNNTLVMKIHDYQGKLISYKRRRLNGGKWITAKGTHPNKQCLVNDKALTDRDNNFLNHIYVVEGHHDFLTAVLLDIDVLMIPTVSYKSFNDYEVSLLKNRDVIFIADYKTDDMSGVDAMRTLAKQIGSVAKNVKVFSLPLFLESENIEFTGDKLDLSEVVELWSDGLESFVNVLEYVADKGIFWFGEELF